MSLDEASRYLPAGSKVMSARRIASTGSAIRNAAYGSICADNSCPTSVESV